MLTTTYPATVTIDEAAALLGLSRSPAYRAAARGELPTLRFGRRLGVAYRTPDGRGRGLHELRRTFATTLSNRGVPLEDVKRLGRWSSPQVLLKLYAASDEDRLRAAADEAADALGGS